MAGGIANLKGGVPIHKHRPNKSNIELAENEANFERRQEMGKEKFPMHVYKPGKPGQPLVREVKDDDDLEDAVAKGWYDDVRDVPEPVGREEPTKVSQMTVKQAKVFVGKAKIEELADIEMDEQLHGNRADVMAFINEAKDAAGSKSKAAKAPKAKAAKATPKKK